jgi:hypothetical protein
VLDATFGNELDERLLDEAIAVEHECCPFFVFDYRPRERRLKITVDEAGQEPALDALHDALIGEGPLAQAWGSSGLSRVGGGGSGWLRENGG